MDGVFGGIVFGWLLGLLNPLIVDEIRRRRDARELRSALRSEFGELRYRLGAAVYQISLRLGELDRDELEWIDRVVQTYEGPNRSENISRGMKELLKLDPRQLAAQLQLGKAAPGGGLSLRTCSTPLLDSRLSLLAAFDVGLQARLLSIRTQIGLLNEEVESSRDHQRLTFDSGITGANHASAVENLANNYRQYVVRSRVIVDQIDGLKL